LEPVQSAELRIKITGTAGVDFLMQTLIKQIRKLQGKNNPNRAVTKGQN
jgi:hypothetical protein